MVDCQYGIYFDIVCKTITIHSVDCKGGHYKPHGGPNTDRDDNCWIHEPTIDEAKQVTRILLQRLITGKNMNELVIKACPQCQINV